MHKTKQKRDRNRTTTTLVLDSSRLRGIRKFRLKPANLVEFKLSVFESPPNIFFKDISCFVYKNLALYTYICIENQFITNAWYCWIGYPLVLENIQLVVSRLLAGDNRLSLDILLVTSGCHQIKKSGDNRLSAILLIARLDMIPFQ